MKLIVIPPSKGMNWTPEKGQYMVYELVENMRKAGQLKGVDIDIDEGYPFPVAELGSPSCDEEFLIHLGVGLVRKVKEFSQMGKYDAIVTTCDLDAGFFATRHVSKIPVTPVAHSSFHVASLIGERFTYFAVADGCSSIVRHCAQNYGFNDKLVSVRHPSLSSTYLASFVKNYDKEERNKVPEVKEIIKTLTAQCIAAIEKDRVDSIIFGCSAVQVYVDEVRQELDKAGYSEVPIICGLYAALEMAKVMVNMKLTHTARAYPGDDLKAKPEFR